MNSACKSVAPSLLQLDAAWFTRTLREGGHATATVTAVKATPMALSGAVADMARLGLSYAADGRPGPVSLIAKIRGADSMRVGMDSAMRLYEREARFYSEFAPRVPVRAPRCYYAGDGTTTPLLLEDLGSMRMGDQVQGLSPADAPQVMDALGDLHAAFWESPDTAADWFAAPAAGTYAGMIVQMVGSGIGALRQRFRGRVDDAVLDAVDRLAPRWGEVLVACAEGPQTLAHNDCRLDNLFFDADGTPLFVDWQIIARTRGTQDVGNLLAGSMNNDELSTQWRALLRRYHQRLLGNGVRHYSFDDCCAHYRQNILYPLGAGIALLGHLDIGDSRGLGEIIVLRTLRHCAELDAFTSV
ncbi:MAG: hypothetical protein JWR07_3611 [Nevskia sp.]|nr:hypothetical protein [Nevskia sp.]